jgi:peptidoglycan hydrolase-like protein with peptidoglycan-binding domain
MPVDLNNLAGRLTQMKLITNEQAAELKNGTLNKADSEALGAALSKVTVDNGGAELLKELGAAQGEVLTGQTSDLMETLNKLGQALGDKMRTSLGLPATKTSAPAQPAASCAFNYDTLGEDAPTAKPQTATPPAAAAGAAAAGAAAASTKPAAAAPVTTTSTDARPDLGKLADRLSQLKLINSTQASELKNGKATDADIAALGTAINNMTADVPDAAKLLIELGNAQQSVNKQQAALLGIGQAGPVDPKELAALQKSQSAVVDAGVAYTAMQPGETLQDLATRYDTSVDELKQLNPNVAAELDKTGGKAATGLLVAVPVASSDVRAAPPDLSQVTETGPNAYKVAAPSLAEIKKAQGATMIRGMGGADVKELQKMLNAQGANPPLALDGKFGPKTEAMLKAYQSANGIQQTGVLGPQTLASFSAAPKPIAQAAAGATSSTGAAPASRVSGSELTGSAFGDKLGDAAQRIAQRMNSVGACAKGVNDALTSLGVPGRGHAYQKAQQLAGNPKFREVNISSSDLANLPRGAVVVWGRSGAKPYGHVSIALGGGREASDHVQNQVRGGRYGTDFGNGPDPQGRQFRVFLPA